MKTVVKSLIYDDSNNVLVLIRSNTHPHYANEEDLPGGEIEGDEQPLDSAIREIFEETGLKVNSSEVCEVLRIAFDAGTRHILFTCKISGLKPLVQLSWEHSSYEWVKRGKDNALQSKDDYILTVNKWLTLSST